MIKLSYRDIRVSYIGQSPYVNVSPYTSNPDMPMNSQEGQQYGDTRPNPFCPSCKSVNLYINKPKDIAYCKDCNSRFSTKQFQQGSMFGEREIPRSTGLFNSDSGSTSMPEAHDSSGIGSGSWSTELGRA